MNFNNPEVRPVNLTDAVLNTTKSLVDKAEGRSLLEVGGFPQNILVEQLRLLKSIYSAVEDTKDQAKLHQGLKEIQAAYTPSEFDDSEIHFSPGSDFLDPLILETRPAERDEQLVQEAEKPSLRWRLPQINVPGLSLARAALSLGMMLPFMAIAWGRKSNPGPKDR